ncbi:DM13 domain-containing protein [Nocardiopsis sp. CNR-923]|uniref:DM13 domain-containing protein n=1 Tax=Nocardiopsis sp. CNR-923 TaxID=1904965 RepID=UPI0021CC8AE0|nr:DM13 domain-containing protein [Nocardiopsis sp. CNR-923]
MEEGASAAAEEESAEPVVLAEGDFVSQEHGTSGTVAVLELSDGSRHVRLEDLATSDGPDLHVWITDQEAGGDWFKYRDGRYVTLGELRGTHGSANYEIPADADISGMTSVVIWCDRFSVAFGSAPVEL